jgi:hypothetical protein
MIGYIWWILKIEINSSTEVETTGIKVMTCHVRWTAHNGAERGYGLTVILNLFIHDVPVVQRIVYE